jgi:hypothetical protein
MMASIAVSPSPPRWIGSSWVTAVMTIVAFVPGHRHR